LKEAFLDTGNGTRLVNGCQQGAGEVFKVGAPILEKEVAHTGRERETVLPLVAPALQDRPQTLHCQLYQLAPKDFARERDNLHQLDKLAYVGKRL
jgi:hypothetical protein